MARRSWRYDLDGIDLDDCSKLILLPLHVGLVPAVMGTLQALTWRARHDTDTSHEIGVDAYARIQEIFTVNDCITDLLQQIVDKMDDLSSLSCICDIANASSGYAVTEIQEQVLVALEGNTDVDFSYTENPNEPFGDVPPGNDYTRCQRAMAVWENCLSVAQSAIDLQLGVAGVSSAGLVALISALLLVPVPVSIILGILVSIATLLVSQDVKDSIVSWVSGKQTAICLIYNSVDAAGAASVIAQYIDATVANPAGAAWLKVFYGSTLMGQFWNDSSNLAGFDGQYCAPCEPGAGDCFTVEQCSVGPWDGGTVECIEGELQVRGGLSFNDDSDLGVTSASASLIFSWIPRAVGWPTAKCNVWARMSNDPDTKYDLGSTGEQPVDIQREDVFVIPSALDTEDIQIGVQQQTFWCAPKWWCVDE